MASYPGLDFDLTGDYILTTLGPILSVWNNRVNTPVQNNLGGGVVTTLPISRAGWLTRGC